MENSLEIKSTDVRRKVCRKILHFATAAFQKHKSRIGVESAYVPLEEEFVSLRDIRNCFTAALDAVSSS